MWQALGSLVVQAGPWGVITFTAFSIIRGWLIPRRTHLDRVGDLKAAIAALEETVAEKDRQIGILLGKRATR